MENIQEKEAYTIPENDKHHPSKLKRKRKFPFSKAIFFESLKSNWKNILGVGGANAILMIIIVGILSTLNINATSDALSGLFDSAGTESTVKSGAISYYQAYDTLSSGYDTLGESLDTLKKAVSQAVSSVNDSTTKTSMDALRTAYNLSYRLASGDEAAKKKAALSTATELGVTTVNSSSSSDSEKAVSIRTLKAYLAVYSEDTSKAHETIMKEIMPGVLGDTLEEQFKLSKEDKAACVSIVEKAINDYYVSGTETKSLDMISYEGAFSLGKILVSYEGDETYKVAFENMENGYREDTSKFISNLDYRNTVICQSVETLFFDTLEDSAYYAYLPSFTVDYQTSELGWPLSFVETGEKDNNGNPIVLRVEVKSYMPESFVEINGGLGTPATIVQKMRKEALTGTPYTDEEIAKAKEDASEALKMLKTDVTTFMSIYTNRTSGFDNPYFHDGARDKDAIEEAAIDKVVTMAKETYLKTYNEEYGTNYDDITAIDGRKTGLSGQTILDTVNGYAVSGISTYKRAYAEKIKNGYSQTDSMLIATSLGGRGIMDQLPSDVNDSLTEMGGMNTYAIIAGKIGFAIACLLIPMVYTVMLSTSLVSQKIENGSLAFTFSTPITRESFIFTEGAFLVFAQVVMGILLYVGSLLARVIGIAAGSPDIATSLPINQFSYYALGNFLVTLAVSAVTFFASAYFNKSGYSLGVGGGFVVFSFLCSILGLFGSSAIPGTIRIDSMNFFNYLTLISLFDPLAVMNGNMDTYWLKLIGLLVISVIGYVAGNVIFKKKDLPL